MNEFIRLKEASELIGKSERTVRLWISKQSKSNRAKYTKRGDKNALLINKEWLVEQYKGKEYKQEKENQLELYERLLQEREQRIQEQAKTIQVLERQVNITNSYLASKDKEYRKLIEQSTNKLIKDDTETKSSWLSRLLSKKVI